VISYGKNAEVSEADNMPRKAKEKAFEPACVVVRDRLYTICESSFCVEHLAAVTVIVTLGEVDDLTTGRKNLLRASWVEENEVDEMALEGLIRMCASAMKGKGQRVLLVGNQDTVDTLSACVLREYMGCNADVAISLLRVERPKCLAHDDLVEVIKRFKPS
jgi:hypothetical protein